MKVSKLFHWLYTILMFLPLIVLIFNFTRVSLGGDISLLDFEDIYSMFQFPTFSLLSTTIGGVFDYLIIDVFGFGGDLTDLISNMLTYWCSVSIIWLVFDLLMYVPLLFHSYIDKGAIK